MDIIQYNAMHKFVGVLDNPLDRCVWVRVCKHGGYVLDYINILIHHSLNGGLFRANESE